MVDQVVAITPKRRAEMRKGLLYEFDENRPHLGIGLITDKELRDGIDAATKYLESRGRHFRSMITNKFVIFVAGLIGFSLGVYTACTLLYLHNPDIMKGIIGL